MSVAPICHDHSLSRELRCPSTVDLYGVMLSFGCIIHCLAAPLAIMLLPLQFAAWLWSPAAHFVVALITTSLVVWALRPGYHIHRQPLVPFLATLGCGLVILGSVWPCSSGCSPWACVSVPSGSAIDELAALCTPLGAACVVLTHLLNAWLSGKFRWTSASRNGETSHFSATA